jgi:hypothetical protein
MELGVVHLKGKYMSATVSKLAWWATLWSQDSQRDAVLDAGLLGKSGLKIKSSILSRMLRLDIFPIVDTPNLWLTESP